MPERRGVEAPLRYLRFNGSVEVHTAQAPMGLEKGLMETLIGWGVFVLIITCSVVLLAIARDIWKG